VCDCSVENTAELENRAEYEDLVAARSKVASLLQFVNNEVKEQENWRTILDIYSRLDKRPIEHSSHPVLVEFRVSVSVCL